MEIELGPFPKYENVRYNAYWSRVGIDTSFTVDDIDIENYKNHLKDCKNNPTIGLLAKKKYITGKPMNYPYFAKQNINYMKRLPEIDMLERSVNNEIKTLYPKTKHIRQYIIDTGRVHLDYIEPVKKYAFVDKLLILGKRFK